MSNSSHQNRRILIIDDTPSIHQDFRKILCGPAADPSGLDRMEARLFGGDARDSAEPQFELESAYQGVEGLELARKALEQGRPYALAFVDVRMPPGLDGVETSARLWELDPQLQIIICTAYSDYSWDEMATHLGKTDNLVILKKPFDNVEVLQLAHALTKKWFLTQESNRRLDDLDKRVNQRTQELREANESLRRRADMENLVSVLSSRFINLDAADADHAITHALKMLGSFTGADRGYLFCLGPDGHTGGSTHEWYADPLHAQIRSLRRGTLSDFGCWMERLSRFEAIRIRTVSELPNEARAEREFFEARCIKSFAAVPLVYGRSLRGFLGFDSVHREVEWSSESVALLRTVGEIFANSLQHKTAAERIFRLNRLYSVLSKINELIIRADSFASLCDKACRIMIEDGPFRLAWVGLLEASFRTVRAVARCGLDDGFVGSLSITTEENKPGGQGPTGTAIRNGKHVICNSVADDAFVAPWKERAGARGYRSMAAFPLQVKGRTVGALNLYHGEAHFFNDEEIQLLDRLSADLSFAMEVLEQKQQLQLQGAALESAANSILITNPEGVILWHNPAVTHLTGFSSGELVGQKASLFKSGRHDETFYRNLWQTITSGQVWRGEIVNRRKDGSLCSEEMTITPVRDEKGVISHFIAIKQEMTERKRTQARLAAFSTLSHRLSTAQTAREAARIIVDVADQLLGWDACTCSLYSPSEDRLRPLLSMDLMNGVRTECVPKHNGAAPSPLARKAIDQGGQLKLRNEFEDQELGRPFGDTSRAAACLLYVPIRNGNNVLGALSIQSYKPNAYDENSLKTLESLADHCGGAMERIKIEEALRTAQDRVSHLVEQSPAVICSLKPEGKRFRTVWVSPNIERLLGYSPAEACEPDWWTSHLHPADREQTMARAKQVFRDDRAALEYRFQHKSKAYRWVRSEQRLLRDMTGTPVEIISTWSDITERKELEQQLRHAQKMEAIGQLAGGVAHDFNNLLAVIHGNTELAMMDGSQLTNHTRDCLKQVTAASERAANLTRQLLAFGRKQVMQPKPLNLNEVVSNLTKMLKRIIGENIELQCCFASRLPFVQADVGMMEQVLVNLVVNARDAMPQGGQLLVTTEAVQFDGSFDHAHPEARAGHFVCLTVSDNGSGIAPEHLPRIFEPFYTTKEIGKGTGLGLATVYGIVKQHQGWIEVSSQVGSGTSLKVLLPAVETAPSLPAENGQKSDVPRGTETILLVEDDEGVRLLTRRLLEKYGYKVRAAAAGPEAIDIWNEDGTQIDLLLTDMIMPQGIGGAQLAESLRAKKPGLKVVFMSGYSPEVVGQQTAFVRRTNGSFVPKPCQPRDLLRAVRNCLDGATSNTRQG